VILTAEAEEAAARLAERTAVDRHDVAIVLGSGWGDAMSELGEVVAEVPFDALPGFTAAGVEGHQGVLRSVDLGGLAVLAFYGRTHFYERRDPTAVAHGVRVAAASGCRTAVLTNACGGIRDGLQPGQLVLISDHINLTGASPLVGGQFIDLTDLYSERLRERCREVVPGLEEGVYVGYWGPNYETPAEIRAFRTLGGDLVGMSTVLEAIAARAAGMEVLGLSLVTNLAAGLGGKLDHEEVLATGRAASKAAAELLSGVLPRL
jgi:purine-nucleoside phosphorylase